MRRIAISVVVLISAAMAQEGPLRLSLKRAVDLALSAEGSPKVQIARETAIQAKGRSVEAKAALLPNLDVVSGVENLSRNLAILGLTSSTLGFPVPARVGPLNVIDARTTGTQTILDLSSLYRYRASKVEVLSAESGVQGTEESVAADVARTYLEALRAEARVRAAEANLELARTILETAEHNRDAGTGAGLEVSRANLGVSERRQELLRAKNEKRRADLLLRRVVGLRLDAAFELTDTLDLPKAPEGVAATFHGALDSRPDWKAQLHREQQSELATRAARAERLPSIQAFADYGATGSSVPSALATHTAGLSVRLPIFDGGRRRVHAEQSASQWRQEKVRTADLREQIRFEVEVAADQLDSALAETEIAEQTLQIAERTFEQARRRYQNGAAGHLVIAEAQNEVARAQESRITSLYSANLAWIGYESAAGRLISEIRAR